MTKTHLEHSHSNRKSQTVYKSPSSLNDPSPYSKPTNTQKLEIDAEDEEAGNILIALAQHANRILNQQQNNYETSVNHSSMSIRNLLDNKMPSDISLSKPFYESRRNSNLKKGYQINLVQRNPPEEEHDSKPLQFPKFKRNATHIHISYRIHAHQISMRNQVSSKYDHHYPSAFRPAHSVNSHHRDWSHNSSLSSYN